ncbi:MAG: alpha/beta hydrolase-fold protein [Ignavibacteriaceae bacterium]
MLLLLVTLFSFTNAQSNKIEIGTIDTVYSKILNEKREVWVYIPHHLIDNTLTDSKLYYPVLYLLDGNWHFPSVVGIIQQLSYVSGNSICPEMIVVGIANTDRVKDFTPTRDNNFSPTSGGNEKFISFIEKELIPYIEAAYPVAPYRMLIGHSLGGLAVINTLINHTDLFNAYVSIDPSMQWNNLTSLKEAEKKLSEKKFTNAGLFLAIANSMEKNMDTIKVKKDLSGNTLHIRSILELDKCLRTNKQNGLNYQSNYYINENHGSVPLIATYDALHFIFNYYDLRLTKNDYADTSMALPQRIENHYNNISEKMGYKVNPSENLINTLGYTSMMMKNFTRAEYYFKLNIKNFPDSFNVYDSLGDYYIAVGNKSQAVDMFTKALSIMENPDIREKLNKHQAELN